jgi:hypothetical protein
MPLKVQKCFNAASQCLDLEHMLPNPKFSVTPALDEDLPGLATMAARHIPGLKGRLRKCSDIPAAFLRSITDRNLSAVSPPCC